MQKYSTLQPADNSRKEAVLFTIPAESILDLPAWSKLVHKQSKPSGALSQYLFWEVLENTYSINSRTRDGAVSVEKTDQGVAPMAQILL
jgi:hypothetical protein